MIANLFQGLGLNRDHWAFLWGKILSIALLVNSGVFDLAAQAAYLGIHLTPTGAHWIQALAVVALYVSGQYSTSSLPGKPLMAWLLAVVLGGGVLVSGCKSLTPLQNATVGESVAVQTVHVAVQAESAAYAAKAFTQAQHDKNLLALSKVIAAEKGLNDALSTWQAASGQPAPAAVVTAIAALSGILADVAPLASVNPSVTALVTQLSQAITQLTGATSTK